MRPGRLRAALLLALLGLGVPGAPAAGKKTPRKAAPKSAPPRTSASGKAASKKPTRKASGRKAQARKPAKPVKPGEITPGVAVVEYPAALEGVFARLEALEKGQGEAGVVRILHFGDSHVASDHLTGRLRSLLHQRFGDAGPGFLMPARPWRGYPHAGLVQHIGRKWPAFSLRSKEADGLFGLAGAAVTIPEGETYQVTGPFTGFRVQTLGPGVEAPLITVADPAGAPLPLALASRTEAVPGERQLQSFSQTGLGAAGPLELSVALPGSTRLLGVELLSGRPGIQYDELGLDGAALFDLEKWDPDLCRLLLAGARPDLIVLAYGANDLGRPDMGWDAYRARAEALVRRLKAESGASVLLVAPTDMAARRRRSAAPLAQRAKAICEALRQVALDTGSAFWDARSAMGGPGSILAWRKAHLAQRDLVHFTPAGYQRLGDLLFGSLMEGYQAFRGSRAGAP
ncbi:MAG TPA: GDSL-type esterase/lipase family protein [Holophaga sp.]|nr:GDSL-type esterase/lipase family protein [Holophaga sp.]